MAGTDFVCQHWKNVFICFLLIGLCKCTEITKDELLAKIKICQEAIQKWQAEMYEAINQASTEQEKAEIANKYSANAPSECENMCELITAQVNKELAEALGKMSNPQQSEIDRIKQQIEAQYPVKEACGSDGPNGGSDTNGSPTYPEISKDELLEKIETCKALIEKLEEEMKAAIEKAGTKEEKEEIEKNYVNEHAKGCNSDEICGQIRAQVKKELAVELSKLRNPQQSVIDTLKQKIEAQFPVLHELCDPNDGGTIQVIPKNDMEQFSDSLKKLDANALIEMIKAKNMSGSFSSGEMVALGQELVKKLGGVKGVTLAEVENIGPAVVTIFLPGEYKYLSNDVFEYILNQIYLETTKAVQNQFDDKQTEVPEIYRGAVSTQILMDPNSARIKALCGRAFRLYKTARQMNQGWNNIKFLMFCAPPSVCKNVDNDLIQKDINAFGFQPWVCKPFNLIGEDNPFNKILQHLLYQTKKLFPSNKPCGKMLAAKAVTGGTSPFQFNSREAAGRLRFMTTCLPDSVIKEAIDEVGCEFAGELYKTGVLSQRLVQYSSKKCLSTPPEPDQVTCASLESDYGPYLTQMKRSFFKRLPQGVMCDAKCMELFKSIAEFPKDVMKYIIKTCFKDSTISSDDVKNLGGSITDLPLAKFNQINAADLETNIKSIKTDLKAGKKQRGRKAVLKKLAKKMIDDGKLSNLIDSKEIMKEISLKDLKTSLSQSDNIIEALGINKTQDSLGFTNAQKKWVVKQVVKKKQASGFTLEDIQEMKSLVTGLLSSHIKKIGEAHSEDTQGMTFAVAMCAYSNWPRKSLEAISKYLIQTSLEVRNAADPMSTLTNVEVQSLGCQCLLNLNTSEYENMDKEVCSAVCMKIGYCDAFRCLNPIRRNNVLQACLKCKGLGSHTITNTDFEELGPNLISQMSKTQLDLVPAQVLKTHIQFFKDICMDQNLRKALSEALLKVIGSSGSDYDANTLSLLGSAIKVLPRTLQQELNKSVIAEMQSELMRDLIPETDEEISLQKCCEKWLDTADLDNLKEQNFNLMLTVKDAFFANVESNRSKRAAFNWTCRQIRPNPILFRTASAKEIDIMDDNEFLDCLEIIGNISNMHRWQHKRLYLKAVKAKGKNVCSMSKDEIEEFGKIVNAFYVRDLQCVPYDLELFAFFGSQEDWDIHQG
ncbi:uncharacterized protein LOC132716131 isoform X2 [Ruditapes philippinarum]|uniref:uncharacterized protein LOC132716131 isoform X2 n=1 Tax=Ruditapes philippinarum TaxID=129788 RepID=UPI00295B670F|nr:uncharacterized protein LOC132716131 isoform X2 [Ruditapes philippinarum]